MTTFPIPLAGRRSGIIGLDIRAMKYACDHMEPYQRGDCPICGWSLERSADDIVHCRFCGYQDVYPFKRDIYPE